MLIFTLMTNCYALEVKTHKEINEYIANNSLNGFSLDTYLKNNLGMNAGKTEKFGTNTVWEWLRDGGEFEDAPPENTIPYRRSRNHFHNPLLPWDQAYYTDWLAFCTATDNSLLISGHCPVSAILWAQGGYQPQATTDWFNPGGDWSWTAVRNSYYLALTSTVKTDRDSKFANTFRGMGQLMHLVQDMSVPEHTRNDFHPYGGYEGWVLTPNNVNFSTMTPIFFGSNITNISNLFDTDQYTETSGPGNTANLTTDSNGNRYSTMGLSEYTNANFFSEDTIFTNFNFPALSSVVEYDEIIDTNTGEERTYLKKTGDGETIEHLATATWFYKYLPTSYKPWGLKLDDQCYSDYAQKLLPRAVGYSAGLLKYFFRGDIDMVPDPNGSCQYIIKNTTAETMNGAFSLYYDDASDNRHQVSGAIWNFSIDANGQSASVSFMAPSDAKEQGKYILVFQGTIGNESGAVAGKVLSFNADMTISGPDAPSDGNQYTVTGGTAPYTWSISKGSITQDGIVTVSGQCGAATVSATDSCGYTATKDVRMPGGVWERYSGSRYSCYVAGDWCSLLKWGNFCYTYPDTVTQLLHFFQSAPDGNCLIGGYWYYCGQGSGACYPFEIPAGCEPGQSIIGCNGLPTKNYLIGVDTFKWECP